MPQFGFYRVGSGVDAPLSIIDAADMDAAKRRARELVEAEGLDALRVWDGGLKAAEVRRPVRRAAVQARVDDDRGERMAARKAEGATWRAIGEEFGISKDRVRGVIAQAERRSRMQAEQPNRAALSVRAQNALPLVIVEPETNPSERDAKLPGRVAALTRRQLEKTPNLGNQTIAELEAWLWERGLTLAS